MNIALRLKLVASSFSGFLFSQDVESNFYPLIVGAYKSAPDLTSDLALHTNRRRNSFEKQF